MKPCERAAEAMGRDVSATNGLPKETSRGPIAEQRSRMVNVLALEVHTMKRKSRQ